MVYILALLTISCLLIIPGTECAGQCSKIKSLLNDNTIKTSSRNNDICILTENSCCNKAVENKLLEKTKSILKNRVFLVLNQFYAKIATDKQYKSTLLTKIITSSTLSQAKKVELNEKFSSYITGVNTLTSADLEEMRAASATGALSTSLGAAVSGTCQDLLYFDMESLKDIQLKYLGSILVMLRGYQLMTELITAATSQDLTEECYIGAVRGGLKEGVSETQALKFGGCNLCLDKTSFSHPCAKLCRNILSGCLKGHIQTREYIQHLALNQVKLNSLVEQFARASAVSVEDLKSEVKSKLQLDNEFRASCSSLQRGKEPTKKAVYDFALNYDEDDARETLDSDWLCKFVFSGVSEVNCWNKSQVGEYRLNIYEFTNEGQRQNPEVPGNGPNINIDDIISGYEDYKVKVEELDQGRIPLKPSSSSFLAPSLFLLTLSLAAYLTAT
ncbi:uncharacterized protein LOC134820549 isoform X2 [Bolinopsis microptera]|uniref:uncharacterized protein LOC134820549 isoform X2 n=1 Tax=Bolinopsis microptera TaxID=2820187 RepID=UPI0030793809